MLLALILVAVAADLLLRGETWTAASSVFVVGMLAVAWIPGVTSADAADDEHADADFTASGGGWRRTVRRTVFHVSRLVIVAWAVLFVLLILLQNRLLYHPTHTIRATPADAGLAFEDVWLTTSDDVKIHGSWVPAGGEAKATVLFCHGNAGNISDRLSTLRIWHGLGANVFIFDYRGYGQSDGSPDEERTYRDARAALSYLTDQRGISIKSIILHGRSLGGAIAAHLATRVRPAGLILESTFTSVPDVAERMFPIFPVHTICMNPYRTLDKVNHIECPVLVIHSPQDDLIPYAEGRRLAKAIKRAGFLRISGDHNSGFETSGRTYVEGLARFLDRVTRRTDR